MASKKRTIVGHPLTPEMLVELGALDAIATGPFSPSGNWTNVYRIWACHGYRESGNEDRGILTIERSVSQSGDSFTLKVTQKINNDQDLTHVLDARILCKNDPLATPLQWQTKSIFYDPQGAPVKTLGTKQRGRVKDNTFTIETNGKQHTHPCTHPLTGDWCLLEAVQRLPFETSDGLTMDILKEMVLLQSDHHLVYRDRKTHSLGGQSVDLHHFQQLGRGMLPYDYWLDSHHRLQVFVTLSIAYIRDNTQSRG